MYTKFALKSLLCNLYTHLQGHFLVLDSRSFKSVSEMYWFVHWYAQNSENLKVAIILNKKFIKAEMNILSCGIDIQDSLSSWAYKIKSIVNNKESLNNSLNCLKKYCMDFNFSKKTLIAMSLITDRKSVSEISKIMKIKPRSAYGYVSKLKCAFHQPTINHLYSFLGELKTSTLNAKGLGDLKTAHRNDNLCIVNKEEVPLQFNTITLSICCLATH